MYSQVSYPTPTTAVLTITDAGPLNVLSTPVIHALTKQLGELAENQELRCLVLRGSGSRAFIAGADIKELATLTAAADAEGLIDWSVSVDSTIARAHQHATNTKRLTGGWIELHESGRRAA